jgi:carbon monoxide dehydrogenase subunit G
VARIRETFLVPADVETAFDLVADFSSTARWDPGIRAARRLDDGAIARGSRFEVELALGPLGAPLTYEVTVHQRPGRVILETEGRLHRGRDDVRFRAVDGGTEVIWEAEFALRGPGRLLDPFLAVGFRRAAAGAVDGLAEALGGRLDEDALRR